MQPCETYREYARIPETRHSRTHSERAKEYGEGAQHSEESAGAGEKLPGADAETDDGGDHSATVILRVRDENTSRDNTTHRMMLRYLGKRPDMSIPPEMALPGMLMPNCDMTKTQPTKKHAARAPGPPFSWMTGKRSYGAQRRPSSG